MLLYFAIMDDDIHWDGAYTWRIEHFTFLSYGIGEKLTSPIFDVKSLNGRKWRLQFYPNGLNEEFQENISLYVEQVREAKSDKECVIDFEISLMNANSKILQIKKDENRIFGKELDSRGWKSFIKIDQVEDEMKKSTEGTLIVRCRIKNKDASDKMKAEKYTLNWPVKIFPNEIFTSTKHFFCLNNLLFEISLSLKDDEFLIHIRNVTKSILPSQPIIGKISLSDTKGKESLSTTDTHNFHSDSESWEFPFSITKVKLQDKINEYVKDGTIVLLCEFSIHCEGKFAVTVSNPNSETVSNIVGLVSLSDDLQSLLSNKSNSDVKLRLPGEVELQSHRSVLTARSPVFSAMFDQKMLEKSTGIVDIEDVDSNTLKSLLEFLYTGMVEVMDYDIATKLLMVADKYQISSLKEICASYLISAISIKKVCEILILGDMVSHEKLKFMCIGFISINAKLIFTCNEWFELVKRNAELSIKVIAYIGRNCAITPFTT